MKIEETGETPNTDPAPNSGDVPNSGDAPASAPNGESGEAPRKKRKYTKRAGAATSTKLPLGAVPAEVKQAIATAPLMLYAAGVRKFAGMAVEFDANTTMAATAAFGAWLESLDVELTPGVAYLVCMGLAISSTVPGVIGGIMAKRSLNGKTPEQSSAPEKVPNAPSSAGSGQTITA